MATLEGASAGETAKSAPSATPGQQRAALRSTPADATAVGAKHLHGEQADRTQADDNGAIAKLRLREPDSVQRNGARSGERGLIERDRFAVRSQRDRNDQVLRDEIDFRVRRIAGAGAGDRMPDHQIGHVGRDLNNGARAGVAGRHRLVEPRHRHFERLEDSIAPDLRHHLLDQVGPAARLVEERALGELQRCAFGAGRDQRGRRSNEHTRTAHLRRRDIEDVDGALSYGLD